MRRARIAITLATLSLALSMPAQSRAAAAGTMMSGVGIIDYTRKPTFKVGDYVRYLVTTQDANGTETDRYTMTVMIASQVVWWGEPCFYVETTVMDQHGPRSNAATLMSYAIFDDSLADQHVQSYMRKSVLQNDPDQGGLMEVLVSPTPASLTSRSTLSQPHGLVRDTLGADTVQTSFGVLKTLRVATHQSWGNTGGVGDSTVYKERREDHTVWLCDDIPITRSARDVSENIETIRSWLVGRSKEGTPEQVIAKGTATARILEHGHGLKSKVLLPSMVHTFDQPAAAKKAALRARPRAAAGTTPKR